MWIRTETGELVNVDRLYHFTAGPHLWGWYDKDSDGHLLAEYNSDEESFAALDRIHEWLSAPWRAEDKEGNTLDASPNVLDLRKEKEDE